MASRPTRSTARLAAILDRLPDALLLVDSAGIVENANAKALEAFGAGLARPLIGLPLGGLLPSLSDVAATAEGADGKPRQMVARALDGMVFGAEVTCTAVPWGGGEERLLICMHQSTGVDAEAELVRTGRAAQAVLRSTEEAICGVDRDGRVVLANPAAGRLFGVRVSAIAGQDLHAMVLHTKADGSPYPATESPVARTLRSGRRIQRRREIVWRADGSPVPVEISTAAIKDGSEVVGAVLALTDITERHELDRRRRRLVEFLANQLEPGLANVADAGLTELRKALSEVLDYENLMEGQGWDERPQTEIATLVKGAVDAVQAAADDGGVRITTAKATGSVPADPGRLTAALAELLRTAIGASRASDVVEVATASEADRLRISVSGVDPERPADLLLQRLRPPRANQRTTDPDLAFVQLVAERHDGRLLIESAAGRRSFVLELPLVARPPEPDKPGRRHARLEAAPAPVEPTGTTNVIPLPARRATAESPAKTDAAGAPTPPPGQVLAWPRPGAGLADALSTRGLGSTALDRAEPPVVMPAGTAVVLIDPQGGTIGRRMLHQLSAAVTAARLPLVLTFGFTEFAEGEHASEPAALIGALLPEPGRSLSVLVVEHDKAVAVALGERLTEAGYQAAHARTDARAAARVADSRPDLVLRNLALSVERLDWLRATDNAGSIPVIAYTTVDLTPGHVARLGGGQTRLGLVERAGGPEFDERLAALLAALSSGS